MELWSWSCRYIKTVIQTAIKETASHRGKLILVELNAIVVGCTVYIVCWLVW